MCGISGILCSNNTDIKKSSELILENLQHRGPDANGINYFSLSKKFSLSMIHSRLSIIDLSNDGIQPMEDKNTKNSIVFNGEIYNYRELKKQLIEDGYKFLSETDTEVLLYAYHKWGVELLNYIEGIFAFAIFDNKNKEIFLAVDHLGIKPLYWFNKNNLFCFCSELRPLIRSNLVEKKINPKAVDCYFEFGSTIGPETIIENINLLESGHYMIINSQGKLCKYEKYWDMNLSDKNKFDYNQNIERLEKITKSVIQQQLTSDAPIALFLSGGIDSTFLTYFATLNKNPINTFTISFNDKNFDEGDKAKETSIKFKTKHKNINLKSSELKNDIPNFINSLDQPSIDGINVFSISKIVRNEGIKVVLSGQGGDELFGGYSTFKNLSIINKIEKFLFFVPNQLRKIIGKFYSLLFEFNYLIPSKVSQLISSKHNIHQCYSLMRNIFPYSARKKLFLDNICNSTNYQIANKIHFNKNIDIFDYITYLETNFYLKNTLLRDSDVMGMANSLEIRVPFLDKRIINFVNKIPAKYKVDKKRPKPLLLDLCKGQINQNIWNAPKKGFTFPWDEWLRGDLSYLVDETFSDRNFWVKMKFDYDEIKKIWNSFLRKKKDINWTRVWIFIIFRKWCIKNL